MIKNFAFKKSIDAIIASKIVIITNKYNVDATLQMRRGTINLKSATQIISMKLVKGDRARIIIEGLEADLAYQELLELFFDFHIAMCLE